MELSLNTVFRFGKYKGQKLSDLLSANYDIEANDVWHSGIIEYLQWLRKNTQYTLHNDIVTQIQKLDVMQRNYKKKLPERTGGYYSDNWNSINSMSDISFQDVYGDCWY